MSLRRASAGVVGLAIVAALASPGAGAPAPADEQYFQITLRSSGNYRVDYFDDRLTPGTTTAIGVDGQESRSWRWELRALGRRSGADEIAVTRAVYRASARREGDLVSYSILMGVLSETPLGCPTDEIRRTWDRQGAGPPPGGDLVRYRGAGTIISGGQFVFAFTPFFFGQSVKCEYHGPAGEVENFDTVGEKVPARVFALSQGQVLTKTFRAPVSEQPKTGDLNQVHTLTGSSELVAGIRRIGAPRWRELSKELAGAPPSRTATEPVAVPNP